MSIVSLFFFGIIALIIIWGILIYNRIVKSQNEIDKSFGTIDAMLKKRYDLIPNLIETVKSYMTHEADVFTEITKLRTNAESLKKTKDKVEQYNQIEKRVKGVMFNVENYPELKASQNFLSLQASWNVTEDEIAAARRYYNTAVTDFNNKIEIFPAILIAKLFNFNEAKVFEIDEQERKNISAKELFKN